MRILLVGSPNSGKSTLFNRLTGLRAKTVNYPGSTVDLLMGDWNGHEIVDAPGIYSFQARSLDEAVTIDALNRNPDLVLFVLDATQMGRQAQLALSLIEARVRCVVIVTMTDLLDREKKKVDLDRLSLEVGARCVDANASNFMARLSDEVATVVQKTRATPAIEPTPIRIKESESRVVWERAKQIESQAIVESEATVGNVTKGRSLSARDRSRAIDRWALHPLFGPVLFFLLMSALFVSIYWLASPLMNAVDSGFGWVTDELLALGPDNIAVRFLAQGVVAGVGAVLVFVPQIFILSVGIICLEDSGYLARAATIVDRPLRALGLGGRSFVPLLSGFACAVPAMLAARTISSKRERLMTLLILPLMSCSARLPVYALLLGFLFPDSAMKAGLSLTALYVLSILSGALASIVISRMGWIEAAVKGESSFLILELPFYRRPKPGLVFKQALLRTKSYVQRAGWVILILSVVIWIGSTFPNFAEPDATVRIESSYLGRAGRVLTPVFEPMGGDWRTGIGLLSAFAAREVFVSTLAVVFHVSDATESGVQAGLISQMNQAKNDKGQLLFTPASVAGLLVFFVIALQCLSTFSMAGKESGSWRFAWGQLIGLNLIAYALSIAVVQTLRFVGVP